MPSSSLLFDAFLVGSAFALLYAVLTGIGHGGK